MGLPFDRAPVVFVMDHDIPHYQDGCLYRSADCLVLVGRRAGPGLEILEALACGVPVIAGEWGSHSQLIDGVAASGVETALVPSPEQDCEWSDPSYARLREALRGARDRAGAAREKALELSARLRTERSLDNIAAKMIERLDDIR